MTCDAAYPRRNHCSASFRASRIAGSCARFSRGRVAADPAPFHLVVDDADVAHAELVARGVAASEVQDYPWGRFTFFTDPDGNGWAVQAIPART